MLIVTDHQGSSLLGDGRAGGIIGTRGLFRTEHDRGHSVRRQLLKQNAFLSLCTAKAPNSSKHGKQFFASLLCNRHRKAYRGEPPVEGTNTASRIVTCMSLTPPLFLQLKKKPTKNNREVSDIGKSTL